MSSLLQRGAAAVALLAMLACSGQSALVERSEDFARVVGEGYRVAVLPFRVSATMDDALSSGLSSVGNVLALEGVSDSAPAHEKAATVMRRAFVASLYGSRLQVTDLWITDVEVGHARLSQEERMDPRNVRSLARHLRVDGIVYGDVHEWSRRYYVAEAQQQVGLRVELWDGRSGARLLRSERVGTEGAGLSGGPTGFLSAGTAPIAGLKGSVLAQLAGDVARASAFDLSGAQLAGEADIAHSGGEAPRISFVAVSADREGPLRAGDEITVVAVGSDGCGLSFDLGRYRRDIPMRPIGKAKALRGDRETWIGRYVVQPGEKSGALPVYVSVRRHRGERTLRSTRRVVGQVVQLDS